MLFKPLEQFELRAIFKKRIAKTETYAIVSYLDIMFLIEVLIVVIVTIKNLKYILNWRTYQPIVPLTHKFLRNILISQLSYTGEFYFIITFILFFIILVFNLLGMIPGFYCVTAQLGFALSLSFSVFFGSVYYVLRNCGLVYFINLFIPQGVPKVLLPLLFVLEVVSFLSRALSLAIRLFANMVAGHSLLHILINALVNIGNAFKNIDNFLIVIIIIPFIVILLVYFLEFVIAFLQAYVFIMLSLIYLKDTLIFVPKSIK